MKAIDLLTGHDHDCKGGTFGFGPHGPVERRCTCRLAERQAEARAIDARVERMRSLLDRAHPYCSDITSLDRDIDALLSEVKP